MMKRWRLLLARVVRSRRADADLDDEIRAHLAIEVRQRLEAGESPEQAVRSAQRDFGNLTLTKEVTRDMWGFASLEAFLRDLRHSVRAMRRSPGLTGVALLSLALGIGANTAIFSILNAVMLKLLPVESAGRLIELISVRGTSEFNSFSFQALDYFSRHATTLDAMVAESSPTRHYLTDEKGAAERAGGRFVNGEFFRALGVRMALGRPILPEDDRMGHSNAIVVLSHSYWQRRFGGDRSVLGRKLVIEDVPFTIAGVAAREFTGIHPGTQTDLWLPLATEPQVRKGRSWTSSAGYKWIQLLGRLKPGATIEQARAELATMYQPAVIGPESALIKRAVSGWSIRVAPGGGGEASLQREFSKPLFVLMAVAGIVLLIACANLANLLLARSAARQREMAVRLSLGAGRGRLMRQLFTESFLLCLVGSLAGLAVAWWTSRAILAYLATRWLPISLDATPDTTVLGFTAAAAVLTTVLSGFAPAFKGSAVDLSAVMKGGGDQQGRSLISVSKGLVVVQVAMLVVLVLGAGLFLQSLRNLQSIDLGFRHDRVLLITLDPYRSGHSGEQLRTMYTELLNRMERVPGVESASLAWISPITGAGSDRTIQSDRGEIPNVHINWVAPKYFATLGMPLLAGRDFGPRDSAGAARVAIITQSFARRLFGDDNPIGRRVRFDQEDEREVIGVAGDAKYMEVRQTPPPTMYLNTFQKPSPDSHFLIRTSAPAAVVAARFRSELESLTKSVAMGRVQTLREQIDASLMRERLLATLSGGFGVLALVLAAVGLYGVIAYTVTRRTREIGIRTALGARPGSILAMVLKETAVLVMLGLLLGLPLALALSRSVGTLLYGIKPDDARVTLAALATLFAVGLTAAFFPARRASRVDPLRALRHE